jgi:hypothetical protein
MRDLIRAAALALALAAGAAAAQTVEPLAPAEAPPAARAAAMQAAGVDGFRAARLELEEGRAAYAFATQEAFGAGTVARTTPEGRLLSVSYETPLDAVPSRVMTALSRRLPDYAAAGAMREQRADFSTWWVFVPEGDDAPQVAVRDDGRILILRERG